MSRSRRVSFRSVLTHDPRGATLALGCVLACLVVPYAAADCGAPERPIVTEVFYDATGDDTGLEFVELLNPTAAAWPLAGVRLEAGDGSGPGRWSLRWTGSAADTLRPHARFVIGGARVTPAPDVLATLDLQNGPDAIRLVWPDGVREVVGYGVHEFAEYACGAPAVDVASGLALARIPDAQRGGSNAIEFRAAPPTPGRPNQPGRDAAIVPHTLAIEPDQPDPGTTVRARVAVESRGAMGFGAGELSVAWSVAGIELAARVLDAPLTAETLYVEAELALPDPGKASLVVRVAGSGDEDPVNDADSLLVRAGPGPLEITEIQFHPTHDEGEWVEVRNRAGVTLDVASFLIGDRAGARGTIAAPETGAPLAPDSFAVLVQDRAAFLAAHPRLDTTRVLAVRSWAALNNTDDPSGVADVVTLAESDGTPCQRVPYHGSGTPNGVPIERGADGTWAPSPDPMGTPLGAPRTLPALPRAFVIAPRRVAPAAAVTLEWSLPWPARLEVTVFDLAGRRVAVALPPLDAGARGARDWSTAVLGPGVYVFALHARAASGAAIDAAQALRIAGSDP